MSVMPKPVLALYNNVTGNMSVIMTTYYLALYENVYTLHGGDLEHVCGNDDLLPRPL